MLVLHFPLTSEIINNESNSNKATLKKNMFDCNLPPLTASA